MALGDIRYGESNGCRQVDSGSVVDKCVVVFVSVIRGLGQGKDKEGAK